MADNMSGIGNGLSKFSRSLYPPLAHGIMTAVRESVTPRATLREHGNPRVLTLDYPGSIKLVATPSAVGVSIRLFWAEWVAYTWGVYDVPERGLALVGIDRQTDDESGRRCLTHFSLRPEIAGQLRLVNPERPELVGTIIWMVQSYLA